MGRKEQRGDSSWEGENIPFNCGHTSCTCVKRGLSRKHECICGDRWAPGERCRRCGFVSKVHRGDCPRSISAMRRRRRRLERYWRRTAHAFVPSRWRLRHRCRLCGRLASQHGTPDDG